jgi:hypothetical protein
VTATVLAISPKARGPTHVVVRSSDPVASNLAGFAVATAFDPEFGLLEIRATPRPPVAAEIPWTEVVPPERHLVSDARPPEPEATPGGPSTAWAVVRADRPEEVLAHLAEFLMAPEAAGQAFRRRFPIRPSSTMLVANGWVVARLFPDDPMVTGRLLDVQRQFGVSVVLATDQSPRRDYSVFDAIFDVLASTGPWGSTKLRCVHAPAGSELRGGDEFTLDEIEGFPAIMARLAPKLPRPGRDSGSGDPPLLAPGAVALPTDG